MTQEIWKDVCGYKGEYQVSNLGRVKSLDKYVRGVGNGGSEFETIRAGRVLKQYRHRGGYLQVKLCSKGICVTCLVHRLVAAAFIPKIKFHDEINHINPDKQNNRWDNLEWSTRIKNMNHAARKGLLIAPDNKGELSGNAILTTKKVLRIRKLYLTGCFTHEDLVFMFGVKRRTIGSVIDGSRWAHIR